MTIFIQEDTNYFFDPIFDERMRLESLKYPPKAVKKGSPLAKKPRKIRKSGKPTKPTKPTKPPSRRR